MVLTWSHKFIDLITGPACVQWDDALANIALLSNKLFHLKPLTHGCSSRPVIQDPVDIRGIPLKDFLWILDFTPRTLELPV